MMMLNLLNMNVLFGFLCFVCSTSNIFDVVQADTMLRFIFNDNITVPGMSCNAPADRNLIDAIFDSPMNTTRKRNLRYEASSSYVSNRTYNVDYLIDANDATPRDLMSEEVEAGRNLQHSATFCRNHCMRFVPGQCRVVGCGWYNTPRRSLQSGNYGLGYLHNSTWCTQTSNYINNQLDRLIDENLVSKECVALLDSPRTMQCYNETLYGLVDTFNMYNATSDLEIVGPMSAGFTMCNGTSINFWVKTNNCVKSLRIIVNSTTNSYVRQSFGEIPPYTLFPKINADYRGEILPIGNYTIIGIPDNDMSKQRSRRFNIRACSPTTKI